MLKEKKRSIPPIVVFTCVLLFIVTAIYFLIKNINSFGQLFGVKQFGVKVIENVIDNDSNFWTEYRNERISFLYPMYLSYFENISATGLTADSVIVAHYLRRPDNSGESWSGRSYWISLMQIDSFFKTQDLDVKEWIISNKFNTKNRDCDSCDSKEVLPIETISIGGHEAYSVKIIDEGATLPRTETVYFHTSEGIKAIGFLSISPNTLEQDYLVYQKIISTLTFL